MIYWKQTNTAVCIGGEKVRIVEKVLYYKEAFKCLNCGKDNINLTMANGKIRCGCGAEMEMKQAKPIEAVAMYHGKK